ncbi:MAG: carbohydrate ABC transporter permease [Actinocatenispora sp.]
MTSRPLTGLPLPATDDPPAPARRPPLSVGTLVSHVLLVLAALVVLFPFLWMAVTALKAEGDVFTTPPAPIGSEGPQWGNFGRAWTYVPFGRFMLNGLVVAGLGTVIVLVTSGLAAYAFARLHFRGRDTFFLVYLGTLMIPQEVIVVPMFILMRNLGWVNSYQALILPWAFTAFGTFLLRQFFLSVPQEYEDAARVDGASRLRILLQVMAPLAAPAFGVLAVFTFITYWNSFLWPLIIVNSQNMATIPLGLNMFLGQHGSQYNYQMAASTLSVLPSVVLVLALQRYLVKGIAMSGLGGR